MGWWRCSDALESAVEVIDGSFGAGDMLRRIIAATVEVDTKVYDFGVPLYGAAVPSAENGSSDLPLSRSLTSPTGYATHGRM
jgi:hypothetical protein